MRRVRRDDVPPARTGGTAPTSEAAATAAAEASAHNLVTCLLRELCGPAHQVGFTEDRLVFRLPGLDVVLRVRLRRRSVSGRHRFTGPVERLTAGAWEPLDVAALAAMTAAELERHHPAANPEFVGQVRASEHAIARALTHRAAHPAGAPAGPLGRYLASEQSLALGHRCHPAPKARFVVAGPAGGPEPAGEPEDQASWRAFAPEARAAFPLHLLGVPPGRLVEHLADPDAGIAAALAGLARAGRDAGLPAGATVLPVHPWQVGLLTRAGGPLRSALRRGELLDLGRCGPLVVATASVRTLYDPTADVFYKTSLAVRITNCVRRNAPYELAGAVQLTRALRPVADELATLFPGTVLLGEPVARTAAGSGGALEGALGVIVREGVGAHLDPGMTPLLAAAVAAEQPCGAVGLADLVARSGRPTDSRLLQWWQRYLALLVPPVLRAFGRHGVVLEPHLQNVVVGVDRDGWPVRVLLRDLEGVRLTPRADRVRAALDPAVAARLAYSDEQGWNRVAYCLLVNNLGEMAAAAADLAPQLEPALWAAVRGVLAEAAGGPAAPPGLAGLLADGQLPVKANLLIRWVRAADRHAGYVHLPAPWQAREHRIGRARSGALR